MSPVAIVTDSASDLTPELAAATGIRVVPLEVTFGDEHFRAGVDLSTAAFWERMVAPDAPFPTTAAASPGEFQSVFEACFAGGAEAVVCVDVAGSLSATVKSATIARDLLPAREIHVVDSTSASMGEGVLALIGAEMAARGLGAREIADALTERAAHLNVFVALDTLWPDSVKPIITIEDGTVDTADRVRTRSKARERVIELLSERPVERLAILYTTSTPDEVAAFRDEVVAGLPGGVDNACVTVQPVGPSVGPHLGPGCLGGVVLYRR